jgi:MFS transporter, SET family, sugar efflux transporter
MSAIRLCRTDPALRAAGLVLALQGAIVCSFGPYFSVLAVTVFGFGDRGYAFLLALSSLITVTASVIGGIRADQTANRRKITLAAVGSLVLGTFLMTAIPGPTVFALAMAVLFPISSIVFGQVFALARLAASRHPADQRDGILAVIRALFAVPFIVVLPLWSIVFAAGAPIRWIFPVGLVLSGIMLLAVLRLWPSEAAVPWDDRPSGLSFRSALAEMGQPSVASRLFALGAVNVTTTIYMAIISLVMVAEIGRGTEDAAFYVGLVAGLEVPFMLILPALTRGWDRSTLILLGTLLYATHVALLPVLAGSTAVWLLVLPAAIGGAVILTVPIAYLQDLLSERPGAGAALMSLQRLTGDVMAALCFALGTVISGYGVVAFLGVAVSIFGAVALFCADRR